MLGRFGVLAAVLSVNTAYAASDEAPEPAPEPAGFAVSAGGHAGMLFGDRCEGFGSDVIACTGGSGVIGAQVTGRYRVGPSWSFGLRGGASLSGERTSWWQASATARWHTLADSNTDLWLGLDAGVVAAAERVEADEVGPEETITTRAPIFGAGIGVDFRIVPSVVAGPALRGFVIPLETAEYPEHRGMTFSTQLGATLEASVTVEL